MTGLEQKHVVPYGRMSQPELRKFLARRLKTSLKPKELYIDELTLKLFGLVPANFDLKQSTVDLLTEQAAAFYDYREKRLFLLDISTFTSEETTLAHELAHALADQHFNLEKFVDNDEGDDDLNLAHSAVVEGQASWLMLAYQREQDGLRGPPAEDQLYTLEHAGEADSPEYPVLQKSPLYIQQSLLFPYTEGTRFFDQVYHKKGKAAFTEVFTNAPANSAQVYHLDRFLNHVEPTHPDPVMPPFHGAHKELSRGSLGEFDQRMLIWQFAGKSTALALAEHARGGEYRIYEAGKRRKHIVLSYISEWDSERHAAEYFEVYQRALQKKWSQCTYQSRTAHLVAGTGDAGGFVLHLNGRFMTSIEGLEGEDSDGEIAAAR